MTTGDKDATYMTTSGGDTVVAIHSQGTEKAVRVQPLWVQLIPVKISKSKTRAST